jgi:serine/threonine-protein kinase HipA
LNIDIYGDEFERDLALAVGDEFVAEKVMPYDLAEFCDASHLPLRQVATSQKNLCTAAIDRMGSLPLGDVRSGEEMDFAQELIEKLKGNAERLLAIAAELPHVRL